MFQSTWCFEEPRIDPYRWKTLLFALRKHLLTCENAKSISEFWRFSYVFLHLSMSKTYSKHYTLHHIMKSSLLIYSLLYFHDAFIFSASERKPQSYQCQKKKNISSKGLMFSRKYSLQMEKVHFLWIAPLLWQTSIDFLMPH